MQKHQWYVVGCNYLACCVTRGGVRHEPRKVDRAQILEGLCVSRYYLLPTSKLKLNMCSLLPDKKKNPKGKMKSSLGVYIN